MLQPRNLVPFAGIGPATSPLPRECSTTEPKGHGFEKLKEAYVKARYSKHYRITEEELTWLGTQVEELGRVVHAICAERIAALENKAAA